MGRSKNDDYFDILYKGETYIKHYTKNPRLKSNAFSNDFKLKLFLNNLMKSKSNKWQGSVKINPYSKHDDGAGYFEKLTTNYDPSIDLPTMRYEILPEWPFKKIKYHYLESVNGVGMGYNTYSSFEENESGDHVTTNNKPKGENTEDNDDNPIVHFVTQTFVYDKLERTSYRYSDFTKNNIGGRTSADRSYFFPDLTRANMKTSINNSTTKNVENSRKTSIINSTTKNFKESKKTSIKNSTTKNVEKSRKTSTGKTHYTNTTLMKTNPNSEGISITDNLPIKNVSSDRCFGNLRLDQNLCNRDSEVKLVRIFIRNCIDETCIGAITCLPQKYKMHKECYTQCMGLRFPEDNGSQAYNLHEKTKLVVFITCICLILLLPILYLFVFIIVVFQIK
ncbi:unnamed protein product [Gordionus sp. m RMFG-2023]